MPSSEEHSLFCPGCGYETIDDFCPNCELTAQASSGNKFYEGEELSSGLTFLYKFVFPGACFFGFGVLTVNGFTPQGDNDIQWFLLLSWVMSTYLSCRFFLPLKHVVFYDSTFHISNFIKTIEVGPDDIDRLSKPFLLPADIFYLHFKTPNYFGNKIVFMAGFRLFRQFSAHPVINKMQRLIGKRRGNQPGAN